MIFFPGKYNNLFRNIFYLLFKTKWLVYADFKEGKCQLQM